MSNTTDNQAEEFEGMNTLAESSAAGSVVLQQLVLDIDGYEGPLDVLLSLARHQKVDLREISILELVEQYINFIKTAEELRLELAADYLVMAAWLAYLKSRLLIPTEDDGEEMSADEMAMRLQLQLQRLVAMREVGAELLTRSRAGRDFFLRGNPEAIITKRNSTYDVTLYDLLKSYGVQRAHHDVKEIHIPRQPVYTLEDAIMRLEEMLGVKMDWNNLESYLPPMLGNKRMRRSAMASMFVASLEMARQGKAEIRQEKTYGPIMLRSRIRED